MLSVVVGFGLSGGGGAASVCQSQEHRDSSSHQIYSRMNFNVINEVMRYRLLNLRTNCLTGESDPRTNDKTIKFTNINCYHPAYHPPPHPPPPPVLVTSHLSCSTMVKQLAFKFGEGLNVRFAEQLQFLLIGLLRG